MKNLSKKFPKKFLIGVSTVILISCIVEKTWKGYDTKQIWIDIKDIVLKTLIAAESHIVSQLHKNCASQKNCFELFGFDIMLDKKSKVFFLILIFNFKLKYTEVYRKFLTKLQCILFPILTYVLPDFFFIFSIFFELQWRVSLSYG